MHVRRRSAILRNGLLFGAVVLLQAVVLRGSPMKVDVVGGDLEVINIEGDLVVDRALTVENRHLRIRGNLTLAKGGELVLKNCVCELLCKFSREFNYEWRGGVSRTENVTIGGIDHLGYFAQANFHL